MFVPIDDGVPIKKCLRTKLDEACTIAAELYKEADAMFCEWPIEGFTNGKDKRKISKSRSKAKTVDGSLKRS